MACGACAQNNHSQTLENVFYSFQKKSPPLSPPGQKAIMPSFLALRLLLPLLARFAAGEQVTRAECMFDANGVTADIAAVQEGENVKFTGTVTGIAHGKHGFHVHEVRER